VADLALLQGWLCVKVCEPCKCAKCAKPSMFTCALLKKLKHDGLVVLGGMGEVCQHLILIISLGRLLCPLNLNTVVDRLAANS
jgi:hypothetical protein